MPKMDVAPTKSNQLKLKRELEIVTEGYEHLDEKRKILTLELMRYVEMAKQIQNEVVTKLGKAYKSLKKALLRNGHRNIKQKSLDMGYQHKLEVKTRQIVGLHIPTVNFVSDTMRVRYSVVRTSSTIDEAMKDFLDCLSIIAQLAEIENAVLLLAYEVKKTLRRVNALDKIFIPSYKETIKFVEDTLEGKELESFFIMKMIKNRLISEAEKS